MKLIIFGWLLFFSSLQAIEIFPSGSNQSFHKGEIVMTMIFHNEENFLREWITYHQLIGVSHFFLYDNGSTDGSRAVLFPYQRDGVVTLFSVPQIADNAEDHFATQRIVYNHALEMSRKFFKWIAVIDADEFICLKKDDSLQQFLSRFKIADAMAIYWQNFGSSGIETLGVNDLQMNSFVFRAPDNFGPHNLFKSISRIEAVASLDIHDPHLSPGANYLIPTGARHSHTPGWEAPPVDEIAIYHYWWRDETYFREVKLPRRTVWGSPWTEEEVDAMRQIHNSVEDHGMARFAPFVEARLNRKSSSNLFSKKLIKRDPG